MQTFPELFQAILNSVEQATEAKVLSFADQVEVYYLKFNNPTVYCIR